MSQITYTPDQQLAIDTEGCEILVSAAAGSGKTAVLTRRVLKKIIDTSQKNDITDFLVVTFTVSSANDLKRKLSEGIREEMKREGADVKRLRRQMLSLSYAKIATIDSFCRFIVKDCAQDLALPVGMSLADEKETDALALEVMEELIENAFGESSANDDFIYLVEAFSNSRSDTALIPALLTVYKNLLNYPEPISLLKENLEVCKEALLNRDKVSFFRTELGQALYEDIGQKLTQVCEWLFCAQKLCETDEDAYNKYLPVIESDAEFAAALKEAFDTSYSHFAQKVSLYSPEGIPAIRGRSQEEILVKIKDLRARAKETLVKLAGEYRVKDESEIFLQLELHIKALGAMCKILEKFHARFLEEKKRRRIMNFSDMSHYAFKALVVEGSFNRKTGEFKKTPYAEEMTARFREILIDEYQDVNALQDAIFRAISNSKNRFMVGDIKQSIYAFRGATPEIFAHLRDTFTLHNGSSLITDEPKSVFLQNNYRSDSKILDFSNRIFSRLMNWESEKYLEKDHLVFSKKNDLNHPVELTVFHKNAKGEDWEKEQEATFVADRIIKLVTEENIRFDDIAVLSRNNSTLDIVKNALDRAGIPSTKTGNKNLFDCYEVLTAISFLKAVKNPTDDVYLASAMTSLPFSFTPDELLKIRESEKNCDFYFALTKACEKDDPLGEKCRSFVDFLGSLCEFSKENSPDRVLWRIMEETGLLTSIKKFPDASDRRENLLTLYSLTRSVCQGEKGNLSGLCDRLDSMAKDGKFKTAKTSESNAVILTTFHLSKGLQFPVVFATGLGTAISTRHKREQVAFSAFGPTFDLPFSQTNTKLASYLRKSALKLIDKALIDEELRCLYVALTRPENRLFITAEADTKALQNVLLNASVSKKSFSYSVRHATSLISLIAMALHDNKTFLEAFSSDSEESSAQDEKMRVCVIRRTSPTQGNVLIKKDAQEEKYCATSEFIPFALQQVHSSRVGSVPYKISVSRLKEGLLDDAEKETDITLINSPRFISPASPASGAVKGTSMHTFMQFTSFDPETVEDIEKEADRLLRDGFISQEHRDNLDFEKLFSLFKSDIFAKIKKSPVVEREKRYTVSVPVKKLLPDEDYPYDDTILIQGVVDCYFEDEDGSYTLIDFKTDRVNEKNGEEVLLERHSKQLTLYAEALSEILPKKVKKILIYSFSLSKFIEVR